MRPWYSAASTRTLTLLLCLHGMASSAAPRAGVRPPSGLAIASINIETHNVFDTRSPVEDRWFYRAANGVRVQTQDAVIRRELLFAVGDRYDPALIAETERNLRRLPFIRRAEAQAIVNEAGAVDVLVRTFDSWTLEVVGSFKRAGGVVNWKAGLAEHDLLGSGKAAAAVYSRDGAASSRSFAWKDPQFLGRGHLEFALLAESAPESRKFSLSMSRPFYASVARSALGGAATYAEDRVATYAGEAAAGAVQRRAGEAGLDFGVAFATSAARTRRVKFGLLARRAEFRAIPGQPAGPIPDNEQLGFLQLGGDWEELDFIAVRRIQKFTRDEDYNLGLSVFPAVAWAPYLRPLSTNESRLLPAILARKGFAWRDRLLLLNSGYRSTYVNGGNGNRLASFSASLFVRGLKDQTLAFHAGLDLGWHLAPASRLVLGEINGLRGYGLSQFAGDRRFLFNIEDRIFIRDELWRLLDIGAVVFYDSGYVWPSSSSVKLADLKNSVGLGLRVAPSRSAGNNPARIDLAYALSDNQSRSRWSLSVLAGQAFGP